MKKSRKREIDNVETRCDILTRTNILDVLLSDEKVYILDPKNDCVGLKHVIVKQARREFYNWFEINICESTEYDYDKLSTSSLRSINNKQDELCKKFNLDASVFDSVLYDLDLGGD